MPRIIETRAESPVPSVEIMIDEEVRLLLEAIEREEIPERLLELASTLQGALAERRRLRN